MNAMGLRWGSQMCPECPNIQESCCEKQVVQKGDVNGENVCFVISNGKSLIVPIYYLALAVLM